jgi:hypothetical protein
MIREVTMSKKIFTKHILYNTYIQNMQRTLMPNNVKKNEPVKNGQKLWMDHLTKKV